MHFLIVLIEILLTLGGGGAWTDVSKETEVTIVPSFSSAPTGTVYICWGLYEDEACTTEVPLTFSKASSAGAGAVSFTTPASTGAYYVKATVHATNTCGSDAPSSTCVQRMDVTDPSATPVVTDDADPTGTLDALRNKLSDLQVNRAIYADGDYNTICLPFAVSSAALEANTHPLHGYERLKAFRGARVVGEGQDLHIDIYVEDTTALAAGVPYLISFPSAQEDIENPLFKDITVTTTAPRAVTADGVTFQGMFAPVHIDPYTSANRAQDYLFLAANNELNWPLAGETSEDIKMRGFRAYFIIDRNVITPIQAPQGIRARIVDAPQTGTGLEGKEVVRCAKFIENSTIVILKNGVRYNIMGQTIQ